MCPKCSSEHPAVGRVKPDPPKRGVQRPETRIAAKRLTRLLLVAGPNAPLEATHSKSYTRRVFFCPQARRAPHGRESASSTPARGTRARAARVHASARPPAHSRALRHAPAPPCARRARAARACAFASLRARAARTRRRARSRARAPCARARAPCARPPARPCAHEPRLPAQARAGVARMRARIPDGNGPRCWGASLRAPLRCAALAPKLGSSCVNPPSPEMSKAIQ